MRSNPTHGLHSSTGGNAGTRYRVRHAHVFAKRPQNDAREGEHVTALIRRELCSARSNEYINHVGVIISGIFFDCDQRTYKYERQSEIQERFVISTMAGRPANITHIVPPNTILTVQAMSVEELGPLQLGLMLQGNTKLQVEWLARRRLLRNTHQCIRCAIACTLVAQRDVADGFRWKCRLCGEKRNIRLHSFFKSNLPLGKLVWLLFSWATEIAMQDMTWHLNISKHTVIDWYNFVRDVCAIDVRNNPQPLGGFDNNGSPIVVEIDESYFYHRKYHRGRVNVGEWVFGAVERERERPLQDAGGAGPEGCHHPAHHPAVATTRHPHHVGWVAGIP